MTDPQAPITCPACQRIDLAPRYAIERMHFDIFCRSDEHKDGGRVESLYLPFLRWDCPGCRKEYVRAYCCLCGKPWLAPHNAEGWVLDCDECEAKRTMSN